MNTNSTYRNAQHTINSFALTNLTLDRDHVDTLVESYALHAPSDNGVQRLSPVFTSSACSGYRYGFQGQEKDDEIKGSVNSLNYEYRMHDPRIGRFFALDPLASKYPHNSPYAFSENIVTNAIELEGLEHVDLNAPYTGADGKETTYKKEHNISKSEENASFFTKGKDGEEMYAVPEHLYKGTDGKLSTTQTAGSTQFTVDMSKAVVRNTYIDLNGLLADFIVQNTPGSGMQIIQIYESSYLPTIVKVKMITGNEHYFGQNGILSNGFVDGATQGIGDGDVRGDGSPFYYPDSFFSGSTTINGQTISNSNWLGDRGMLLFMDRPGDVAEWRKSSSTRITTAVVIKNYAGSEKAKIVGYIVWGYNTNEKGELAPTTINPKFIKSGTLPADAQRILNTQFPNF